MLRQGQLNDGVVNSGLSQLANIVGTVAARRKIGAFCKIGTNENNLANKSARLSGVLVRRLRNRLKLSVFKLLFEFVAFLTRHFQVEHQVLDVESQLRQGLLDQRENPATAANRIDDALMCLHQLGPGWIGQSFKTFTEIRQFPRNLVVFAI